jgi:hypothetical protein
VPRLEDRRHLTARAELPATGPVPFIGGEQARRWSTSSTNGITEAGWRLTKRATFDGEAEKANPNPRWRGVPGECARWSAMDSKERIFCDQAEHEQKRGPMQRFDVRYFLDD